MTFEKEIQVRLKRIFDIDKVTFNRPSESKEQEGMFVEIVKSHVRTRDARQIGKLEGVIHVFANAEKLPIGYFAKKISESRLSDSRCFFFGPEETLGITVNIAERKFDFTFLFDSQYDPALGTLETINLSYSET